MSEQATVGSSWYYRVGKKVRGPYDENSMIIAIMDQDIDGDTKVWNICWPEDTLPKPVFQTELSCYLGDDAKKKYTPKRVPDGLAWLLALYPAIFSIIDSALLFSYNSLFYSVSYSLSVAFLYSIIALVDALRIKKNGRGKLPLYWFWLTPIYLVFRAKTLKKGMRFFWIWLGGVAVYIVIVYGVVYSGNGLFIDRPAPNCTNAMVNETAEDLIENALNEQYGYGSYHSIERDIYRSLTGEDTLPYGVSGYRGFNAAPDVEKIVNVEQIAKKKKGYSCAAIAVMSNGVETPFGYDVKKEDRNIRVNVRAN